MKHRVFFVLAKGHVCSGDQKMEADQYWRPSFIGTELLATFAVILLVGLEALMSGLRPTHGVLPAGEIIADHDERPWLSLIAQRHMKPKAIDFTGLQCLEGLRGRGHGGGEPPPPRCKR